MIPFLDLKQIYKNNSDNINMAINQTIENAQFINGKIIKEFEKNFADFTQSKYVISLNSGLDALYLSLRALNIGTGDEVIVPTNTFIATWLAVSHCGAKIVPVEPDPTNHTINISQIEESISRNTKAIIPVHLYGMPAKIDEIMAIAKKHNIFVIEDAAQAHGAQYKGRKIGSHGDLVCWSFYPGKNLGAFGDGGAISTNNSELAEKIRLMRNYGSKKKYEHELLGFNSRLDSIQAAILNEKLKKLEEDNQIREKIAMTYLDKINTKNVTLPEVAEYSKSSWHLFVIQHEDRDRLMFELKANGVETLIHYPIPPFKQRAYSHMEFGQTFDVSDKLSKEVLSLPIGPHMTISQACQVADLVNRLA